MSYRRIPGLKSMFSFVLLGAGLTVSKAAPILKSLTEARLMTGPSKRLVRFVVTSSTSLGRQPTMSPSTAVIPIPECYH